MGFSNIHESLVFFYGNYVWDLGTCWYICPWHFDRIIVGPTVPRIHDLRTWYELAQSRGLILLGPWCFSNAILLYEAHLLTSSFNDGNDGSYQFIPANFNLNHGESWNGQVFQ